MAQQSVTPTFGNLAGAAFNVSQSPSMRPLPKIHINQIFKFTLSNRQIEIPTNKENYEKLLATAKKLLSFNDAIQMIFIHNNSIYIEVVAEIADFVQIGITLGSNIRRYFGKEMPLQINQYDTLDWDELVKREIMSAEMLYEEYVEKIKTDSTADLFGESSIIPFEKLPEYVRIGTFVKMKDTPKQSPMEQTRELLNAMLGFK